MTARRISVSILALAALAGGCATEVGESVSGVRHAPPAAPPPGAVTERVSPLHDTRGLHPGLTPVPAAELGAARALVAQIPAKGRGARTGYARDRFGPAWSDAADATWGHDGCRTREQILRRDLRAVTLRPGTGGCVVLEGLLGDPYTGRLIEFSKSRPEEVQIDHVIALADAWRLGAARWDDAQRLRFANDPLNLLAVDGPANSRKGDRGAAAWLPPRRAIRCAYAVRIAQVAQRYRLPLPGPDQAAMLRVCGG